MSEPVRSQLRVALAQIAPVYLDRDRTLAKVVEAIREATRRGAGLVAFGEALVPGYPVWIERVDGARFDAAEPKALHAMTLEQAVQIEAGHLERVREAARDGGIAVVLGVLERPGERGGKSVYCTRVFVEPDGEISSVHRKLMPTYEERLSWSIGDGAGLSVHPLGPFHVGSLLCWENWMPLARAALYAAGEDLHVALWPGGEHNTREITRFVARESRSYCLSASGLLRAEDIPSGVPLRERIAPDPKEVLSNGGSAIAGPDGEWILEPVTGREEIFFADLDPKRVLEERQNFDPSGHYARPDVLRLTVDRRRQQPVRWIDDSAAPDLEGR